MATGKEIRSIPKVQLLFEENIESFNRLVLEGKAPDLKKMNLSGLDLRKAHLAGLDLSDSYLRNCDLRGVDLSGCNLHGASMQGAQISGALFPENVSMEEIRYSIEYGTRIRTSSAAEDRKKTMALLAALLRFLRESKAGS